jgi:hypothetical protein
MEFEPTIFEPIEHIQASADAFVIDHVERPS